MLERKRVRRLLSMMTELAPVRVDVVVQTFLSCENRSGGVVPSSQRIYDAQSRAKDMFDGFLWIVCVIEPCAEQPT